MKKVFLVLMSFVALAGCETVQQKQSNEIHQCLDSIYIDYAPVKIGVLPLSEAFTSRGSAKFAAYIKLSDGAGSTVKWPGVFRFELYQKNIRTAEPKGNRLILWPDIDMTEAQQNNDYWQDALGCYRFDLDLNSKKVYGNILRITFIRPDGKRITLERVVGK